MSRLRPQTMSGGSYLEDGKKNDVLHPDPNIDDAVQLAQSLTKVPLSWKRNKLERK